MVNPSTYGEFQESAKNWIKPLIEKVLEMITIGKLRSYHNEKTLRYC